jgi:hypothetical protein
MNTLYSLISQSDPNWIALIVTTSSILPDIQSILNTDLRFKIIDCTYNQGNSINFYKNYGTSFVYTDWVTHISNTNIVLPEFISNLRNIITKNAIIDSIFYKQLIFNREINTEPSNVCYKTVLFYSNYKFEGDNNKSLISRLQKHNHKSIGIQ